MSALQPTTAVYTTGMGLIDRIRRIFQPDPKPRVTFTYTVTTDKPAPRHPGPPNPRPREHQNLTPQVKPTITLGKIISFPELPTRRIKIVGMGNYCTDGYRRNNHPNAVVIQAEPTNPVDPNAITVATHKGRRLGYIAAGTAKTYHQVVASLGSIEVPCEQDGLKWWMEVPTLPALRKEAQ